MHSPLDFMYDEYVEHKKIFNRENKKDYMMLSSGTNQFPLPKLWKETIAAEINMNFTYQLYVSPSGFDTVNKSIRLYENFTATNGQLSAASVRGNNVCMTIGSSQSVYLVLKYLYESKHLREAHIIGYNYALYEKLAKKRGFNVNQITGDSSFTPSFTKLSEYIVACPEKSVFVFTHPNNPSGEQYTQKEYEDIIFLLKKKNIFVIFDVVCNMIISRNSQVFVQSSITSNCYWANSIIINSFSKTDSAAGFRIGYVYGINEMINYVFNDQSTILMALPSFPVLPIFFTMLFRCLYLNTKFSWNKCTSNYIISMFKHIFYITVSIPDKSLCDYIEDFFSNIKSHYDKYVEELLENERIIKVNYKYITESLSEHILKVSAIQHGFNFMIKVKYLNRFSEFEFVSEILKDTGLAILTESAFSLEKAPDSDFWFRISLAYPEIIFKNSTDKLNSFLSHHKQLIMEQGKNK